MKKFLLVAVLLVAGCTQLQIDSCIKRYHAAAPQISLDDSKEKVCSVLDPTQDGLPDRAKKPPDTFTKDGKIVNIIYYRTGRTPDDMTTDDEFTPYIFEDGKLTAIGWHTLGGPKTQGRIPTRIYIQQTQHNR
jgi:hypothetical protein